MSPRPEWYDVPMSDKPIVGLVIAAVVAPVALLCCLGPVVLGSILGGIVGWFDGLNLLAAGGVALATSLLTYGFLLWRKARRHQ
jgi:hypothetical protein